MVAARRGVRAGLRSATGNRVPGESWVAGSNPALSASATRRSEESMTARYAGCSCEQPHLVAEGEPVRISVCHCLPCQRRPGIRVSDHDEACSFRFCPDCGATVFYTTESVPELIAVPVGAFADPGFPAPRVSVREERRHRWLDLPGLPWRAGIPATTSPWSLRGGRRRDRRAASRRAARRTRPA
jgi:hypothetical protein